MKRDEYKMTQQVDTTNYKEKYEQALERAKKGECIENIFPELRESEDEQHRKWILEYLYDGLQKSDEQFKDQFNSAIAWLEKQGEQKPAVWSEEDERIYNEIIDFFLGDIETRCATIDKQRHFGYWLKSIKPNHWRPSEKQMEALNKDLEEAATKWDETASFQPFYMQLDSNGNPCEVKQDITTHKESFKAGVEWQKQQMMKNVVLETEVLMDCDGDGIETPYEEWLTLEDTEIPYVPDGFKDGDIVKVILIKEDLP